METTNEIEDYGQYLEEVYERQADAMYEEVAESLDTSREKREKRLERHYKRSGKSLGTNGNKAHRSKESILADAESLMLIFNPIFQRFPKIERIDGIARDFRNAIWNIVRCYKKARECKEIAEREIQEMIGWYGVLDAGILMMDTLSMLTDKEFFAIAMRIDAIRKGVVKWKRSLPASVADEGHRRYGSRIVYPAEKIESSVSIEG